MEPRIDKEKDSSLRFERIFQGEIYPRFFENLKRPSGVEPKVIFVGGQPGSGKSVRERYIVADLNLQESNTAIEINGDDFRAFHPDYYGFLSEDDATAASRIDKDNKFFIERSIEASIEKGAHVVLEGTFRQANIVAQTAEKFAAHGYASEAILLVVHPIISRVGIMMRYFEQKLLSSFARYTELSAHDAALNGIEATVRNLAAEGLVNSLHLITRDGNMLLSADLSKLGESSRQLVSESAASVLNDNWAELSESDKEFARNELKVITAKTANLNIPAKISTDLDELKALVG